MFFSENSIFFLLSLNFQLKTPCPPNQLKIQIEKEKFEFSEKKNIFPENLKKLRRRPSRASEHGLIGETQPDAADFNRGVRHLWRCCFEVRNRFSLKSSATRKRARA